MTVHTCQQCSDAFTPARADAAYCSAACRQKAYRQRTPKRHTVTAIQPAAVTREQAIDALRGDDGHISTDTIAVLVAEMKPVDAEHFGTALDTLTATRNTVTASGSAVPTTEPLPPLTFTAAAQRLGCDVNTIRRGVRAEQIPTVSNGRRVRIPAAWIQQQPEYRSQ